MTPRKKSLKDTLKSPDKVKKSEVKTEKETIFSEEKFSISENENFSEEEAGHRNQARRNDGFCFEDIGTDDEVYTVQCPEGFSLKDLEKKLLKSSEQDKEIELNYISVKKDAPVVFPSDSDNCMLNAGVEGHIIIKKNFKVPEGFSKNIANNKDWLVKYPKDIKVRHPLLGADWEVHINAVDEALKRYYTSKKKSKKDKKRKHSVALVENSFEEKKDDSLVKRSKKAKIESEVLNESLNDETVEKSKKKKEKHRKQKLNNENSIES